MSRVVLITGGAGFIGSHLADALLQQGHRVRVLDNLDPQVHGEERRRPDYLDPDVELIAGDVRDPHAVRSALEGVDSVFHFAAKVGVGQSMYAVENYTDVNNRGTTVLLEALVERASEGIRLVVASSMSIYGEGLYRDAGGNIVAGQERSLDQLRDRQWEVMDDRGNTLTPLPTPETKMPSLASVYALSKFDQERLCLLIGRAYNIPTVALRFFNVYGTRQALSNPYTGVLAIFASRLLNGNPPLVNEDGQQRRDFVSVRDVAQACLRAMEKAPDVSGQAFNVGSGRNYTVLEIGRRLAEVLGKRIEPEITGKYRVGDIRHCFADISHTQQLLGYEPQVALEDGLIELAQWLENQIAVDRVQQAAAELGARGLTV
ncbi:MAG: NAD-dependent epimerase/dehydratase family protein [Thermoanaerobaculia bacterium]